MPVDHEQLIICDVPIKDTMKILTAVRRRSPAELTANQTHQIMATAQTLFSIINKHENIFANSEKPPLACVEDIFARLSRTTTNLSTRKLEVCSRILAGMPSTEIALDLEIGKESVIEYRKQLYQALAVNSQHQLLQWYLEQ